MRPFMDEDFLLHSETAKTLFHAHAAPMPIIDYHCHLDPKAVADNERFQSITQVWLEADHYKWRAMRANGVEERFLTGDATPWEKFEAWARTMPYALRNPLYHWTHMELRTAFGIRKTLSPQTAREIFDECNDQIKNDPKFTPQGMMRHYNVEVVCTTDDPVDTLEHHARHAANPAAATRMLPTWRPDKAAQVEKPAQFAAYVERLSDVTGRPVNDFNDFVDALQSRHDFFASMGCRLSDHGMEEFYADPYTDTEIKGLFKAAAAGKTLDTGDIRKFKSAMYHILAVQDAEAGWAQQFHYGVIRDNNTKMLRSAGPDTGFDSIGEFNTAKQCARFLDRLNSEGHLAKTILYNLNPCANEALATMVGNFQEGPEPGKIQMGAAWWFLDQKDGITRQLNTVSQLGLLSRFVGMLTDSRSFLSYTRHEYFRRILCNLVGADIENGEIPYTGHEAQRVNDMIEDIAYRNAKRYFKF